MKFLLITLMLALVVNAAASAQIRYFTVRDSIEMARFVRENPDIVFSPNKKYFAVVTSKGNLRNNTVESTIWIFNTIAVRAFLQSDTSTAPPPRAAVRWAAVPQVQYLDSYEPVISGLQWLPDSKTILFLAQNSHGERQIDMFDLSGSFHALTPQGYDVTQFVWVHGSIIYEAKPSDESFSKGRYITGDASDITGLSLDTIFSSKPWEGYYYNELWITRNGKRILIAGPSTAHPIRLLNHSWNNVFSLSPNGNKMVVLSGVEKILPLWHFYESADASAASAKFNSNDSSETSQFNSFRPAEYTLLDLQTGKVTPLVDAPDGESIIYADWTGATWSSDGKNVLLVNTFLPLNDVRASENAQRVYSCAAAVVNIISRQTSCVVFNKRSEAGPIIIGGSFGQNNDEALLHFRARGGVVNEIERYAYKSGVWKFLSSSPFTAAQASQSFDGLSVTVKQNLNVPPALWVTNDTTGKTKELWDPNPQLAVMDLGKATVFQWKDSSGYMWTAGLVKPPGYVSGKRYPLVIQLHGFDKNEFLSDGSFTTAFAARPLAAAGMIVLQIEDNHQHEGTLQEVPDQIRGYESAIQQLTAQGLIDPHRVGIIGFSRTCYYVEGALITDPQLFAAASITDGVDYSYLQYIIYGPNGLASGYDAMYGIAPFGDGIMTWAKEAPGFHLDSVRTPLQITAITASSILGEWEIYASLEMQKKPVDFRYIPNGQHILQKPLERMASQQGTVDWFRFYLLAP